MNFANVKEWVIPEGDVKKVVDSQNRIIWHKDTYTIIDFVTAETNKTGIIVPLNIPAGSSYEIMMDAMYFGSNPSSYARNGDIVQFMGTSSTTTSKELITGVAYNTSSTIRPYLSDSPSNANLSRLKTNINPLAQRRQVKLYANQYINGTNDEKDDSSPGYIVSTLTNNATEYSHNSNSYNVTWRSRSYNSNTKIVTHTFASVNSYWGFGLFANSDGTVYLPDSGKFTGNIYECYIKVGDEYSCHLYPAIRDKYGTYGLYDVINDVFYPSITTNPFTHTDILTQSLTLADMQVPVGGTRKISRTFLPITATNQTCIWESSNPAVATVDSDGNVTGISYGNVTITATTTDGSNLSATCNVLSYIVTESIVVSPSSAHIPLNSSRIFYFTIYPENATFKTLTWHKKDGANRGTVTISKNSDQTCTVTGTGISGVNYIQLWANSQDNKSSNTVRIMIDENTVPVTSVSLNKSSASIGIDGTVQLIATVNPSDATYTGIGWSTNDSSIATVSSAGLVTGVSAGVATITASVGGKTATCSVTVTPPDELESITVTPHSATLVTGSTKQLNVASYTPSTAGTITYTWNSSDTSVATVSNTGLVTAVSTGYAVISCTGHGYNNSAAVDSCTVTVTSASTPKYTLTVTGPSGSTVTIDGYGNGTGSASATDFDRTTISYSVQKTGYTTVTGSWTLNGADKTISVTLNQIHVSSVSLNKNTVTLGVNGTETLIATVTPSNALNKSISWSSSNTNIATVNQSGKITANAAGTAVITVTTADGGYTATCNVTVVGNYTLYVNGPSGSVVRINGTATNSMTAANGTTLSYEVTKDYYNTVSGSWTLNGADKTINVTLSPIAVTGVSLNKSTLALSAGNTSTLTATVTPSNALDSHVKWTSSNTSAATVSNSGSWVGPGSQTITGVALGTAVITVTTSDGGYTATCNVTVSQSGDPGKSLTIANNTGFEIKYGKANNESTMSTLGSSNSVNVTLASGESLYILRSYSGTTINLSCLSEYGVTSGSYRITYANAIDGETIHTVVAG